MGLGWGWGRGRMVRVQLVRVIRRATRRLRIRHVVIRQLLPVPFEVAEEEGGEVGGAAEELRDCTHLRLRQ